jgi:hypothetical protein
MQVSSVAETAAQKELAVQIIEHIAKVLINAFSGPHREISRLGAVRGTKTTKIQCAQTSDR